MKSKRAKFIIALSVAFVFALSAFVYSVVLLEKPNETDNAEVGGNIQYSSAGLTTVIDKFDFVTPVIKPGDGLVIDTDVKFYKGTGKTELDESYKPVYYTILARNTETGQTFYASSQFNEDINNLTTSLGSYIPGTYKIEQLTVYHKKDACARRTIGRAACLLIYCLKLFKRK